MELAQPRQDLVADQATLRVRIRRVDTKLEPLGAAISVRLLAPDLEQRTHDAVLALRLDSARRAARDEAIQDGLHLIAGGVPGRAKPIACDRVADLAELVLG